MKLIEKKTAGTTQRKRFWLAATFVLTMGSLSGLAMAQRGRTFEHVLIETSKPYDRVVSIITSQGGRVTHQFTYVDAISADIPTDSLNAARTLIGPASISKDVNIPAPRSVASAGARNVSGKQIGPVVSVPSKSGKNLVPADVSAFAGLHPDTYSLNNAGTRIEVLHAHQHTGQGTIVAVIDSGYRPGFASLDSPGDSSLIGGKDFVNDGISFSDIRNDGHGTFAAGLISGSGTFTFSPDNALLDAIKTYAPKALGSNDELPLLGTAPDAKIFAVRVFGVNASSGAPLSRILTAIQYVIDLRKKYDAGDTVNGVKIEVCNLSLGVSTINAGRGLLDASVDQLLDAGIIPVVSAGNTGPSSLTIASPGSSRSALTVGGISRAANDRILADLIFGEGTGALYQPSSGTQTAWFSSRGPNADGRLDPDVVVSGLGNLAQGYCPDQSQDACDGNLSIASGTSFSAPIVAGIAAVLREAFPAATATQIRNAIILSGRKGLIDDGSIDIDRGSGVPDAAAAYEMLKTGQAPDFIPGLGHPDDEVERNVERHTDLVVYSGNVHVGSGNLKPGQRFDVLYRVDPGTEKVVVNINHVEFSLPLAQQNPFFGGDDVFVNIHSAKTSSIGAAGDYAVGFYSLESPYVTHNGQFTIDDPDTGIMRVTVLGDFINAGKVAADVNIHSVHEALPRVTAQGVIANLQTKSIPIEIPAHVHRADFLLSWEDDWGHFPTSDIDMAIVDPNGNVLRNSDGTQPGTTLAGPERATVADPMKGTWQVIVDGFNVPAGADKFQLRVTLDGKTLKP